MTLISFTHTQIRISKKVVQHSASFNQDQLVVVSQYHRGAVLGYPLAVGRAALSSDALDRADEQDAKGKAVYILHTWKDSLWDLGPSKKLDVPEPRPLVSPDENAEIQATADATANLDINTPVADGEIATPSHVDPANLLKSGGEDASQPKQPAPTLLPPEGEIVVLDPRRS